MAKLNEDLLLRRTVRTYIHKLQSRSTLTAHKRLVDYLTPCRHVVSWQGEASCAENHGLRNTADTASDQQTISGPKRTPSIPKQFANRRPHQKCGIRPHPDHHGFRFQADTGKKSGTLILKRASTGVSNSIARYIKNTHFR